MFDTSEYYGGTYPDPPEYDDEMEQEDEFDMGDYIDYCYELYQDKMLMERLSDNNE